MLAFIKMIFIKLCLYKIFVIKFNLKFTRKYNLFKQKNKLKFNYLTMVLFKIVQRAIKYN
jgi:hypothetical protein